MTSSKPYLIRAIYEWIIDNDRTPLILVDTDSAKDPFLVNLAANGQVVLNLAPHAVVDLEIGISLISFKARFSGVERGISVPTDSVLGIFSKEENRGMEFDLTHEPNSAEVHSTGESPLKKNKSHLQIVK